MREDEAKGVEDEERLDAEVDDEVGGGEGVVDGEAGDDDAVVIGGVDGEFGEARAVDLAEEDYVGMLAGGGDEGLFEVGDLI